MAAIPLSVAALALPATATAGAGNINPWAPQSEDPNSNSTTFSQSEAVSVAQTFNILVAHNIAFTTADITAMKAANSKLKLYAYENSTFWNPSFPGPVPPIASDYLLDSSGHQITQTSTGNFLMDPTATHWRSTRTTLCKSNLMGTGFDGCFLDDLGLAPILATGYLSGFPINKATNMPWTASDWVTAEAASAKAIATGVGAKPVIGNGLTDGGHYFGTPPRIPPTKPLLASLKAGSAEEWLRLSTSPATKYPIEADWKLNVDMLPDAELAQHKPLLTLTKLWDPSATQAQKNAWLVYSLASFLLGTQGKSAFFFSPAKPTAFDSDLGATALYTANLGTFKGAYSAVTGQSTVFQRKFSNGLVLVNPNPSSSQPITLTPPAGKKYCIAPGTTIQPSPVTLAANQAQILTVC